MSASEQVLEAHISHADVFLLCLLTPPWPLSTTQYLQHRDQFCIIRDLKKKKNKAYFADALHNKLIPASNALLSPTEVQVENSLSR